RSPPAASTERPRSEPPSPAPGGSGREARTAKVLRPIAHEDRLSVVDHLDALRSRMIVCLAALIVAFGVCFWQNHALLDVLNRALPHVSTSSGQHGLAAVPNESAKTRAGLLQAAAADRSLAASPGFSPAVRQQFLRAADGLTNAAKNLPRTASAQERPITIGVGEPFTITLMVAVYFALLFALPLLIYEAYAFIIPALNSQERRIAFPVMVAGPALFITGVLFTYFVVLTPAIHFLQGYNSTRFDILVQAKSYYSFEVVTMLAVGVAFQLPLGLLALQQLGVINGRTLTRQWRYAAVIIAVIAAAMPGADPVTTGLETLPLILL